MNPTITIMTAAPLRIGGIAVAALLALTAGCVDSSSRLLDEAGRAMATDQFDRAAHLYQEVTIATPESSLAARAHFELAQIYYLRRRNVSAARASLVKVLKDFGGSGVELPATLMLARLYSEDLREPSSAIGLYRTLLEGELDEDIRRETLLHLAECYFRQGELEQAADAYRLALALPYHPDNDGAFMRLANLERLSGSAEESIRLLRRLLLLSANREHRLEAAVLEIEQLIEIGRMPDAGRRLREGITDFARTAELAALEARLERMRDTHSAFDGAGSGIRGREEEQKAIGWSAVRRRQTAGR